MFQFGRSPAERQQEAINRAFRTQQEQIAALEAKLKQTGHRRMTFDRDHYDENLEKFREHEQRYANTILLLGYGGFFALWSTTAGAMPKGWFGACGIAMGLSLLIFVVYELRKIAASSWPRAPNDPLKQLELANAAIDRANKAWAWYFFSAVSFGLFAGFTLLFWFGYHAMTGPWGFPG